jgi:D-beta-D-heptose 7-phosphate kinase/D-beta-D-heptose 1-phosphate adenosyltransferase
MLDCYLSGSADRLCQEAPVPVVAVSERRDYPGGAANTAANVSALGGNVRLLSVIGEDAEGDRLQQALQHDGISTKGLIRSAERMTLAKQRVMANHQLLVRFDQGSTDAIVPHLEQQLIDALMEQFPQCDAVIVSDYGYGILTPRIIQILAALQLRTPRTVVVDSKQLWAYRCMGVTAVKPNYVEALKLLGLAKQTHDRAEQLLPYGDRLLDLTGAAIVAVTLDAEGAIVFTQGQLPYSVSAQPMPQQYTSGAGDTFISALTLALAAGASTHTAAFLAAKATAVVVRQPGTTVCTAAALCQLLEHDLPLNFQSLEAQLI